MATIATLYKSGEVAGNSAYVHHPAGIFVRKCVFTITAATVLNDVWQLVDIKAGECLHAWYLKVTDMDNDTDLVLDLGYGNSATETAATSDDLLDGSTIGQAGGFAMGSVWSSDDDGSTSFLLGPLEFTSDDTIDLHAQAGAGTPTSGTITFYAYISKG